MCVKPRELVWSASPIFLKMMRASSVAPYRDVKGYLDYWSNRLEASVADPKFKELKEYAKEVSKAQSSPDGAAEAPIRVREESP